MLSIARAPQPWDHQDQRRPAVGAQRVSYHPVPKVHPSRGSGHTLGVLGTPSPDTCPGRGGQGAALGGYTHQFSHFPHLYDGNNSCRRGAAHWKGLAGPRLPELRKEDVGSTQEDFSIAFHEPWVWGFDVCSSQKKQQRGLGKKPAVCRRCGNSQLEQRGRTHR